MPYRQETATVRVIRQIRDHSRECHNLPAREVLLRIERRMIEFLEDGPALPAPDPWSDQDAASKSDSMTAGMMARA
ncbi:hypothetical protein EI613_23670 [Azospirillum sp. 412522]|nr:hypothetical protein [Azospirillum sp. 412522]MBY6264896.1 hypothetical protein [Azospirillum sp. 412522]